MHSTPSPMPPSGPGARGPSCAGPAAVVGILLAIVCAYVWILSAGRMTRLASQPDFAYPSYDLLADAFLHGQTDLLVRPSPELLALPDPYDPDANNACRIPDALLHKGRYYLYWGPAPAVLAATVKYVTGGATVPDEALVLAFTLGTLGFGTLLLLEVRGQFFPALAWTLVLPGVLVLGLGNPLPFMLSPGKIYQAAIMGGQCFLLAGLYAAIRAFRGPSVRSGWLGLAGLGWSLAILSRVSLAPAIAVLALLLAWRLYREGPAAGRVRRCLVPLGALGMPLVLAVVLIGLYNQVRFGSPTEFGVRYQLAGINMPSMFSVTSSFEYFLPNLRRYLFYPPQLRDTFPFVVATYCRDPLGLPATRCIPYLSYREPVAGILYTAPFVLFAAVPLLSLLGGLLARHRRPNDGAREAGVRWVALLLASAVLLGFGPALFLLGNTMRYLADGTPCLFLLATLGFWQAHQLLAPRPLLRLGWLGVAGSLAVGTAVCGLLLGVNGYYGHLRLNNPQLFETLREWTLPRWKRLIVTDLLNGNMMESRAGKPFFWMGGGDTVLQVRARRPGVLRATATFEPGPSGPDTDTRSVLVITDKGFTRVLTFGPGRQTFRVPVRQGLTTIVLRALDQQVHRRLPDRDWRQLILGVENLHVHLEKPDTNGH